MPDSSRIVLKPCLRCGNSGFIAATSIGNVQSRASAHCDSLSCPAETREYNRETDGIGNDFIAMAAKAWNESE